MKLNVTYPDLFFSICKFTPILVCIACTFGQWLSTSFGQYIPKNRSSRGVNPLEEVSGQRTAYCSSCGHALPVPWKPWATAETTAQNPPDRLPRHLNTRAWDTTPVPWARLALVFQIVACIPPGRARIFLVNYILSVRIYPPVTLGTAK